MSDKGKREVRRVTVRGLGGLTLAGVAMGLAVGQAATAGAPAAGLRPAETLWLAAGTEGGEGGEAGAAPVAADQTVDLLVNLAKVEAHALTALDLAAAGDAKGAADQLHGAKEDIFENIEGALKDHKAPIFEDALLSLTEAAAKGKPAADLTADHAALQAGIEAARAAIAPTAKEELAAVLALTREAAGDFDTGVKDGKLAEAGEYQDARAYLLAGREVLARLAGSANPVVKGAAEKSAAALDPVIAALPDVLPKGPVGADQGMILAAAARVELAAYPVK